MPISAVDAISLAIEHTKKQLFQPFRFGQWVRLAFVGLLAGEMGSGGCNGRIPNFNTPQRPSQHFLAPSLIDKDPALFVGLILVLVAAALVLGLVLMYIGSVMRFILFDSVLARECHIRMGWNRRQQPGWRFFIWKLLYTVVTLGVVTVLIGIPALFAYAAGWFTAPSQHVLGLVLAGAGLFFVFLIFIVAMSVIYVLTKDFVVPQMALENIGVMEGWRRLWEMIKAEKGGYAGYIGMKILLAIGAGIILGIVGLILMAIILIPVAGGTIAAIFAGKAAGLEWTVYTITLAVVAGCVLLAILLFLTSLIAVPAIVFFPAYAMYFFAARYPALSVALYPAPAGAQIPGQGYEIPPPLV